jgi:DNA (cytosine-5)-methyltransferase 1
MYGLDLFSGIGGLTKALCGYVQPVAYCELDPYARGVLLSRQSTGDLPCAPIWDDVQSLDGRRLPAIDIIYGGFPCQDISVAGRGRGLEGGRSGLFFQILRLAKETKAPFLFLENVPAIRTRGLGRVIKELDKLGYGCRWGLLSAADVGANHKRERWFLLAHSTSKQSGRLQQSGIQPNIGRSSDVADTESAECARNRPESCGQQSRFTDKSWWAIEPNVGRVANGVPKRVDRLRALGNAVVPAQAREAFERLMGIK